MNDKHAIVREALKEHFSSLGFETLLEHDWDDDNNVPTITLKVGQTGIKTAVDNVTFSIWKFEKGSVSVCNVNDGEYRVNLSHPDAFSIIEKAIRYHFKRAHDQEKCKSCPIKKGPFFKVQE